VIDPVVRFTAILSGNYGDAATAVAADSQGNVYVTGLTNATDFPQVLALQGDQPAEDAFVTKLSSSGTVIFSTYLGGNVLDSGKGIAVDSTGIYVTGTTNSTDFPIKNSIYPNRGGDAFVTKLNLDGNSLIYSTYLGGSNSDRATGIAVDSTHAAWVAGTTSSQDFPIAGGPAAGQQRQYGGTDDAFLAKLAPDGLSVVFSTFVGGPGEEGSGGVAIDRIGSVYATGVASTGFPITTGMKPCGTGDAFVVRLKGIGTQARYATCLGPANGLGIAVDSKFNAYVTGYTFSGKFPTTPGAFQPTKLAPDGTIASGFVTKLGSSGSVIYSTYLGGKDGYTYAFNIAVDRGRATYVVGATSSVTFPKLPNPGGFLSKLTPHGNGVHYSASFGSTVSGIFLQQPSASLPPRVHIAGSTGLDAFVVRWE
jgi:hypothetical protein